MFTSTRIFKARSRLTLQFTRAHSQVGNRGCKLEKVSFPPLCFVLHGICKTGDSYLKSGFFTILYKLASLATLGRCSAWQHLSVPPAYEAEAATGPQLHSTRSMLPAWPRRLQSLWAPLHYISHSPRGGKRRERGDNLTGPRVSLAGTVTPPHKINGDNCSTEERKKLPEFSLSLDFSFSLN